MMGTSRQMSRRRLVRLGLVAAAGASGAAVLAACGETQIVEIERVVTKTVVEIVTKEVPVETVKIVTKEVPVVSEVIREVPVEIIKEVQLAAPEPLFVTFSMIGGVVAERMKHEMELFSEPNPNVKVRFNISGDEIAYKDAAPQLFASGDRPDIAWYWLDGLNYQPIVRAGLLQEVDDLWERENWADVLPADTVSLYTHTDGHKYAVNIDVVLYPFLYWSKEAFAQAGLDDPGRWYESLDELYDVAGELRAAGFEPLTWGGQEGWLAGHEYDALLQRNLTESDHVDLFSNWAPGATPEIRYTDPDVQEVHQTFVENLEHELYATGFLGRNYDDGRGVFTTGKAGIYMDGSWANADAVLYDAIGRDSYDWMLYPRMRPDTDPKILSYAGNALMIPKGGQHLDVTKEIMAWITSKERNGSAAAFGTIPSRIDITIDDEIKGLLGPHVAAMLEEQPTIGTAIGWDGVVPGELAFNAFTFLQEILAGSREPETMGEELEAIAEELRTGE